MILLPQQVVLVAPPPPRHGATTYRRTFLGMFFAWGMYFYASECSLIPLVIFAHQ